MAKRHQWLLTEAEEMLRALEDAGRLHNKLLPNESLKIAIRITTSENGSSCTVGAARKKAEVKKKKYVRRTRSEEPLTEADWQTIAALQTLSPRHQSVIAFFRDRNNKSATEEEINNGLRLPAAGPEHFSLDSVGSMNTVLKRAGTLYALFADGRKWGRGDKARPYKFFKVKTVETKKEKEKKRKRIRRKRDGKVQLDLFADQ